MIFWIVFKFFYSLFIYRYVYVLLFLRNRLLLVLFYFFIIIFYLISICYFFLSGGFFNFLKSCNVFILIRNNFLNFLYGIEILF